MEFENKQENTGDFQGKNTDLDRYGVWVKKPPRTIHDSDENQDASICSTGTIPVVAPVEEPLDSQDTVTSSNDTVTTPDEITEAPAIDENTYEAPDLNSELENDILPDFQEFEPEQTVVEEQDESTIEVMSPISDEPIDTVEGDTLSTDESTHQSFIENTPEPTISEEIIPFEDNSTQNEVFDMDEETAFEIEPDTGIMQDLDSIEEVESADNFVIGKETFEESLVDPNTDTTSTSDIASETLEIDDFTPTIVDIPSDMEMQESVADTTATTQEDDSTIIKEGIAVAPSEQPNDDMLAAFSNDSSLPDFDDGEISLDAFFSDSPAPGGTKTESVDMSSFGDGEISLDAFFDDGGGDSFSVEDFMPSEKKEKNDIVDDPPMDIQLDFDDDFALNTRADPTGQMENFGDGTISGFSDSDGNGFDFDEMFDSIADESIPAVPETQDTQSVTSSATTEDTGFDEVTEFDDLLGEIENAASAAAPQGSASENESKNKIIDYDITVSMDDDDIQEVKSIQTDTDDDDTVDDISLYTDTPDTENSQQNQGSYLDRTQSSEYTTTYSAPDDDFDIDKLMSEVEDIGGDKEMQTDASNEKETNMAEALTSQPDIVASNDIFDDDFFATDSTVENSVAPSDEDSAQVSNEADFFSTDISEPDDIFEEPTVTSEQISDEPDSAFLAENEESIKGTDDTLVMESEMLQDVPETDEEPDDIFEEPVVTSELVSDEPDSAFLAENEESIKEPDDTLVMESEMLQDVPEIDEEPDVFTEEITELEEEPEPLTEFQDTVSQSDDNEAIPLETEEDTVVMDKPEAENDEIFSQDIASDVNDATIQEEVDFNTAASHIEEEIVAPMEETVLSDNAQDTKEQIETNAINEHDEDSDVLKSIAGELAVLRQEISSLKNDFEALKRGAIPADASQEAEDDMGIVSTSTSESSFFADNEDDDDTLALSGDELSNILNTADFTEEEAEPSDTENVDETGSDETDLNLYSEEDDVENNDNGLPQIDFESEQLEEPEIDDIDFGIEPEEQLPEEIEVPVTEDSVEDAGFVQEEDAFETETAEESTECTTEEVDTTSDVFEDSTDETVCEEAVVETELATEDDDEQPLELEPDEQLPDEIEMATEEPLAEDEDTEDIFQEPVPIEINEDTEETVAEDEAAFLEETVENQPVDELNDEDATILGDEDITSTDDISAETEEEITDEPTEAVFESSQWNDEPVSEELPVTSGTTEDTLVATSENTCTNNVNHQAENDIPDDLKRDIKSVLSYMDQLLDNLPEEKIAEFARSEHFELYKKLFTELGLS